MESGALCERGKMLASRQRLRAADRDLRQRLERRGIAPTREWAPLFMRTRELIQVLANRQSAQRASDAADLALRGFDVSARHHPPEVAVACRRGCSLCCYSWVGASAPEIFRVVRHVRQQKGFDRALQRIERAHLMTLGRNEDERLQVRMPCALLDDTLCTVYPGRPLVCRGMASTDVTACEGAFEDGITAIPRPVVLMTLRAHHAHCLLAALQAHRLPTHSYELNHAVWIALTVARAEERWLEGEDIFARVDHREVTLDWRAYLDRLVAGALQTRDIPV
jgi:putative zinc- or iron-chelating protein